MNVEINFARAESLCVDYCAWGQNCYIQVMFILQLLFSFNLLTVLGKKLLPNFCFQGHLAPAGGQY